MWGKLVQSVISQVFASINHELSGAFSEVVLKSEDGKNRFVLVVVLDVAY